MADTILGDLYEESGANVQVQSFLRHYASRVDALARWQSDHDFAIANPNDPRSDGWLSAPEPPVPSFDEMAAAGWQVVGSKNYRADRDPQTGEPLGSYGYVLFTNTNIPNTLFRVNAPTDAEGHDGHFAVLQGADGAANLNMNEGSNLDPYLLEYAAETKLLFSNDNYDGYDFVDLNESMSGTTAPLGDAIATAMGKSLQSYTYNGFIMSGQVAQTLNNEINRVGSELRNILGANGMAQIATQPGTIDNPRPVVVGTTNQHYLVNSSDLVGNTLLPPENSIVDTVDTSTSFTLFVSDRVSEATQQVNPLNYASPEEYHAAVQGAALEATLNAMKDYGTATHVSEVVAGLQSGNGTGYYFGNSSNSPFPMSSNTVVHRGAQSYAGNAVLPVATSIANYTQLYVSAALRGIQSAASAASQAAQKTAAELESEFKNAMLGQFQAADFKAAGQMAEGARAAGLTKFTVSTPDGKSISVDGDTTTITGHTLTSALDALFGQEQPVSLPNYLQNFVDIKEAPTSNPTHYLFDNGQLNEVLPVWANNSSIPQNTQLSVVNNSLAITQTVFKGDVSKQAAELVGSSAANILGLIY